MAKNLVDTELARRTFLGKCGKYALVTPPLVTLMLSVNGKSNYALALSGANTGDNGYGSSSAGTGGGGNGSNDPGILQGSSGSTTTEFGVGDSDIVCRTSRATPSRWRETACTRTGSPSFEMDGPFTG